MSVARRRRTFLTNALLTVPSSKEDEARSGIVSSGFMSWKDSYPGAGWFLQVVSGSVAGAAE